MNKNYFLALLIILATATQLNAQVWMVENKGQWNEKVKFMGDFGHGAFFLQKDGYKMLVHNQKDLEAISGHVHTDEKSNRNTTEQMVHSHAYEVKFLNSNPNPQIIAEKAIATYHNYFIGNDTSKWAGHCRLFQVITYKEMYPGVDVRYYTDNGFLKYDLIVHPGADASRIALQYDGLDNMSLKNNELVYKTNVGVLREGVPLTYQMQAKGKKEVGCNYLLDGNMVRFQVEAYDKTQTLVIDPSLVFSTFTGTTSDNWGFTATYGPDGSAFGGGIVFGNGFPVTNGAFQTNFAGGNGDDQLNIDIGICKFSPDGSNLIYATYLGGSGNEQPHSMVADNAGNLVIAGRTSSSNYPTIGANVGPLGGYDIIITKLNATGTAIIGSKKIGGGGQDGVNIRRNYDGPGGNVSLRRNYGDDARSEVILDGANNIWLASATQSNNFPTVNAFQTANGGAQDAVVIKCTPDVGTILLSSYYGGSGDDAGYVLAPNPTTGLMYMAGGTASNSLPGNFAGTVGSSNAGSIDGYIIEINPATNTLQKGTFIGTGGFDQVYGIQFDQVGFPYVMGTTTGSWPVINAAFSQPGGKQFVGKLRKDLSGWVYSTAWGTGAPFPNISPTAFLVDKCENVYISGWGGPTSIRNGYANAGTQGLSVTPDAIKATSLDNGDFYFMVIQRNASRQLYGSFFGETNINNQTSDHVDGGTSRFDRQGVIYQAMCANCFRSTVFPTTSGAWSPNNPSTGGARCNEAVIKIAFNFSGVESGPRSSIRGRLRDTSGCVPMLIDLTDTIGNAKKYIWDFGDGSPRFVGTSANVQHTYNIVGIYQIMLIAEDSTTCNIRDTAFLRIRVRDDQASTGFTFAKVPPCNSTSYDFTNTSVPSLNKSFNANSFLWLFNDGSAPVRSGPGVLRHTFPTSGTYKVSMLLVDTAFCNAPDTITQTVRIAANVKAQFKTPPSGCAPYRAVFENTSLAGTSFEWDFGDGSPISTAQDPTHTYPNVGTYRVRLIARDPTTCNLIDTAYFTITVNVKPTAGFNFSTPQENTPIQFFNTSTGAVRYLWKFGDGDTLLTNRDTTVSHIYNVAIRFNACLIVNNQFACYDTVCKSVLPVVSPLYDVPTAFTPNGDGINDYVQVLGYGITSFTWKVYNRWGQIVFSSLDRKSVWDGKFNGVLQPMDTYAYTLDIELSDGRKETKKGNITLIR